MFISFCVLFFCCVGLSSAQGFTEDYYVDEFFGSTESPAVEPGKYIVL